MYYVIIMPVILAIFALGWDIVFNILTPLRSFILEGRWNSKTRWLTFAITYLPWSALWVFLVMCLNVMETGAEFSWVSLLATGAGVLTALAILVWVEVGFRVLSKGLDQIIEDLLKD